VWLSRHLRREETNKEDATRGLAALSSGPKLDLGFKEGQTITINMPVSTVSSECLQCFDAVSWVMVHS